MTSDEINQKIKELDGRDDLPYVSFGSKAIPYIGWYWRTVDFDAEQVFLGILPVYDSPWESNDRPRVGFMQNNKWDYDYLPIKGEPWSHLRSLIETALTDMTAEAFKCVDDYMQSLLPERYNARD